MLCRGWRQHVVQVALEPVRAHEESTPGEPVPELALQPTFFRVRYGSPAADQRLMRDFDFRLGPDRGGTVGAKEGDTVSAKDVEDRQKRFGRSPGHGTELGQGLPAPDRVAFGVDLGERAKKMLHDPAVRVIRGCRR